MSAREQLRESLREAAGRDIAATRARRRRRRRRGGAVLAIALVGGGAAAQATDLFESGPTAPDIRGLPNAKYAPGAGERRQIAVKLRVPGVALPVGIATYRAPDGRDCALLGAINGTVVGDLDGGRFRPFAADRIGTCNAAGRATYDVARVAGRNLVYGLAASGTRTVTIHELGMTAKVGPGRAFLFVVPEQRMYRVDARE